MSIFCDAAKRTPPRHLNDIEERLSDVTELLSLLSDAMVPGFELNDKGRAGLSNMLCAMEGECAQLCDGLRRIRSTEAAT